jgi:hypothetical protein
MKRLRRYVLSSDNSSFVGRVYDLSIVKLHFETYDEASKYADAKYVVDVNSRTSLLTRRVESLNHIGDLLWPRRRKALRPFPVSAYEYCDLIQDAFLMRTISVLDCCCILLVAVLELNLDPRRANVVNISKLTPESKCLQPLMDLSNLQSTLRAERNVRFHRAEEEQFTDNDSAFKTLSLWSHWGMQAKGQDADGNEIDVDQLFVVAINRLRSKFNLSTKAMIKALDKFYKPLEAEFEERFKAKCNASGSYMRVSRGR